jgi:hypothetical protein
MSSKLTAGDLQVITRVAVFRGLKPETVQHIIEPATAVMLQPHQIIMRQDDPATAFFIVIDGWVKISRTTQSGAMHPRKSGYCPGDDRVDLATDALSRAAG